MRRFAAYIMFAATYVVLVLIAGIAADQAGSETLRVATGWVAPFAAAPLALMVAARFGRLGCLGVAVTSTIVAAFAVLANVGVFVAIAVPVVGGPTISYLADMFASYFTIGGWRLLLGFVLITAAPPLWVVLLMGLRASRAPAAA